jgi:BirA family biotin operon repressor/biotin-[acetyl-CoA-carboxylase] ligase
MSGSLKLCGILIENIVKNKSIQDIIIGIGVNINQMKFNDLPNATSVKKITGKYYNNDEILSEIVNDIKFYFNFLKEESLVELQKLYESNLYRLNKVSTFKLPDSNLISGYINGVNDDGRLKIILENDVEESYGIKEISLIN